MGLFWLLVVVSVVARACHAMMLKLFFSLKSSGIQTSDGETQTGANQPQSGDITTPDAGEHPQRGESAL